MTTPEWSELSQAISQLTPPGVLAPEELAEHPEPVARYLGGAIADGTTLAPAVQLTMRGSIKIGRWLPFRARQLLAPSLGTVWEAHVARVISGSDRFVAGVGGMDWRLFGRIVLVHADGADVSRSAAQRAAGESIWAPTAAMTAGTWSASGDDTVIVDIDTDGHHTRLHHRIDSQGQLLSSRFDRWGDPDDTGTWSLHPFGVEVTGYRTFGGVTIPNRGRVGWHVGTDRWPDGEFFRFEITSYELVP